MEHDYTYTTPEDLEKRVAYLKELEEYKKIQDLLTEMPDLPMKGREHVHDLGDAYWRKQEW